MYHIEVNFAKDYQKDSYNKTHLIEFFFKEDKDLLTTFKKNSYLKICGILNFPILIQNF
jgi:hypothetical protein